MTTSSTLTPDLQAICRSLLGRDAIASERVGSGMNSRVFRVDLDRDAAPTGRRVVVKFYRRDAGDTRDRLSTEFRALQFLWQNNVRSIPYPIAMARDRECAIYEYIAGDVAAARRLAPEDIDASVEFLAALKRLSRADGSQALAPASEACFSVKDIVASVDERLERLRRAPDLCDHAARMRQWIDETVAPFAADVREWCRDAAVRTLVAFDEPLPPEARTLSPSDFGFHNAIRRSDGTLTFLDFEYFGWDDPAKTIVDYLLHPGMALDAALKERFTARALEAFADVPRLPARVRIVYPLFGLKWVTILLNDFLPERVAQSTADRRALQLAKAQSLAGRVAAEYASNPFLS